MLTQKQVGDYYRWKYAAGWDEAKHPRADDGKFGSGGSGADDIGDDDEVDVHDPKTGETFWTGPASEARLMLAEEEKENPGSGLEMKRAAMSAADREAERVRKLDDLDKSNIARREENDRKNSLKNEAGFLPGHPEYKDPPPKLYHATFSGDAIKRDGFKSGQDAGKTVLGGAGNHTISFTTKENAETYAEGLRDAQKGARGELSNEDLVRLAPRYGTTENTMRRIVAEAAAKTSNRADIAFQALQQLSFEGKKFPLFMGGSWPQGIDKAGAPTVLALDASKVKDIAYSPAETEWRVGDKGLKPDS